MENTYDFLDTSHLDLSWELLVDGRKRALGRFPAVELAPGERAELTVEGELPADPEGRGAHLTLIATTNRPMPLLPVGHEVAWEQFEVPVDGGPGSSLDSDSKSVDLFEDDRQVRVRGDDFELTFSRTTGALTRWRFASREWIVEGPKPNYWRPPTDNDLGNGMQEWPAVWQQAGPGRQLLHFQADEDGGGVVVESRFRLTSVAGEARLRYRVRGDGSLRGEHELATDELPDLPRMGTQWRLPADLRFVSYFGRGPHETYPG